MAAKSARSVTRSQVFSHQYWHFRSFFFFFLSALAAETHFWYFLPILAFFHLFAYTDFQNCHRSSSRSRTKTKIANKDVSIGGKDDDHWRFQFCYRYWQKNASIGTEKRQYWHKKTPVLAQKKPVLAQKNASIGRKCQKCARVMAA